ncbi:BA14K family protein [Nordella sp. HKS 07]|uniref:BA14K family protein n=1 Tax=Nordella sp. HKS 07 TaxID=2712222 RepID=UPI0013E17E8F|nr:BA14K family protein [Nordella sp. HKS 07]QIG50816.1 BA14K family protein [Nordella sp. HKS 07]
MNRTVLAKCVGAALAVAVTAGFAGAASASPRGYCDSYARDVASRKTNGGADVLVGTVGGAVGGALLGGIIDNGRGAGRGAIIGGVGGTLLGAGVTSDRYRRAYDNAYANCMDNYQSGGSYQGASSYEPGSRAWVKACSRKYRSFNPDTGKYKSNSGQWRTCRI